MQSWGEYIRTTTTRHERGEQTHHNSLSENVLCLDVVVVLHTTKDKEQQSVHCIVCPNTQTLLHHPSVGHTFAGLLSVVSPRLDEEIMKLMPIKNNLVRGRLWS